MLLTKCQGPLLHRYLMRNASSPYLPIAAVAANLVTNLSALRSLDSYPSKCAINQLNSQLNSLIHQYNDRPSADRSPTVKPNATASEQHSSGSANCLPTKLEKQQFKLSDLISVFYILNLNMETDNLVNSLRKAFKNENVNEIMGLHGRVMSPTSVGKTGKQFSFENFSSNPQKTQFKKSELLDSSILSKVKHVYHNTLNRLRFCSYHLKVGRSHISNARNFALKVVDSKSSTPSSFPLKAVELTANPSLLASSQANRTCHLISH